MNANIFANLESAPRHHRLSVRQYDVLAMRAKGLLNKQIAYELGISEHTVKEHISAALKKMSLRSVEQAIVLLARTGML